MKKTFNPILALVFVLTLTSFASANDFDGMLTNPHDSDFKGILSYSDGVRESGLYDAWYQEFKGEKIWPVVGEKFMVLWGKLDLGLDKIQNEDSFCNSNGFCTLHAGDTLVIEGIEVAIVGNVKENSVALRFNNNQQFFDNTLPPTDSNSASVPRFIQGISFLVSIVSYDSMVEQKIYFSYAPVSEPFNKYLFASWEGAEDSLGFENYNNYKIKDGDVLTYWVYDTKEEGCGIDIDFVLDSNNPNDVVNLRGADITGDFPWHETGKEKIYDTDGYRPKKQNPNAYEQWYQREIDLSAFEGIKIEKINLVQENDFIDDKYFTEGTNNGFFMCFFDGIEIISEDKSKSEKDLILPISATGQFCQVDWQCSGWSECANGISTRTCEDKNFCETSYNKPLESRACETPKSIQENSLVSPEQNNYTFWIIGFIVALAVILILVAIVNSF